MKVKKSKLFKEQKTHCIRKKGGKVLNKKITEWERILKITGDPQRLDELGRKERLKFQGENIKKIN